MSLTSPRVIFPSIALALAALMVASCGQQNLPTSPSVTTALTGQQAVVAEYFMEIVDPTSELSGAERYKLLEEPVPPPPPPGSIPDPWPPTGPPQRGPAGTPLAGPPSTNQRMHIKIDPDPNTGVPHSGVPVGIFACRNHPYTWYYDQTVATDTGLEIKIQTRYNYFDNRWAGENRDGFNVRGNSGVVLHTRWCSSYPRPHFTQTNFKVSVENGEEFSFNGPYVALKSP